MKHIIIAAFAVFMFAMAGYGQNIPPLYLQGIATASARDTVLSNSAIDSITATHTAVGGVAADLVIAKDSIGTAITTINATIQTARESDSTDMFKAQDTLNAIHTAAVRDSVLIRDNATSLTETNAALWTPSNATNYLLNTVNYVNADSVWSGVGTHEVITITGACEFWLAIRYTADLAGADSMGVQFGTTVLNKAAKVDYDAGDMNPFGTKAAYRVEEPSAYGDGDVFIYHGFSLSTDIGYIVGTGTIVNSGTAQWMIWWKQIGAGTVSVTAGTGGTL